MALYLVRWPDLSCTLVTARDEVHLGYVLDEVGNAEGCRWTEYDGPVFIDFQLPVRMEIDWSAPPGRPLSLEAVRIEDLELLAQRADVEARLGAGETGGEMLETIMRFAFPATAELYYEAPEEDLDESQLRDALRADLTLLAESTWRHAHTERAAKEEPLAKLAVEMDAPMQLAKLWEAMVTELHRGDHHESGFVDGLTEKDEDVRMLSPLELLDFETAKSQTIPLRGHPEFTLRDEANAITAHVFRNGFLEDLHSGLASPLLTNPRFARITDPEMEKLMVESSAKLAHWLCLRDMLLEQKPAAYMQLLTAVKHMGSRNWEREAERREVSAPKHEQACASCNYPLHPDWRRCPMCEKPV